MRERREKGGEGGGERERENVLSYVILPKSRVTIS